MLLLLAIVGIAACSPAIDGPRERQRSLDRDDGDRLAAQLASLPGVISARATIHRVAPDPLAPRASHPATPRMRATNDGTPRDWPADSNPPDETGASLVIVVDDKADRAAIERDARKLARVVAPEVVEPAMVISLGGLRPELANVGPFRVEASSRRPLLVAMFVALGAILAMAGWVIYARRTPLVVPPRSTGRSASSRPPASRSSSSSSRPPSSRSPSSQPPTRREVPPRNTTRVTRK